MASNIITNFLLDNIDGNIYFSKLKEKSPIIIISHGFKGWKDWGFLPYLAEILSKKCGTVITYNFSLNGRPDNNTNITKLEDFAQNTISQEINDLTILIQSILTNKIKELSNFLRSWNNEIYLAGHSLGAGISIIAAQKYDLVKKVLLWASIGKFDRYSNRQKEIWKKKGFIEFDILKTGQKLKMNADYLLDIEKHQVEYDLSRIIKEINKPIHLIHGKQDLTVPLKEIQIIIDNANYKYFTFKIIDKTGHTFGAEHPFNKSNPYLDELICESVKFFKK